MPCKFEKKKKNPFKPTQNKKVYRNLNVEKKTCQK